MILFLNFFFGDTEKAQMFGSFFRILGALSFLKFKALSSFLEFTALKFVRKHSSEFLSPSQEHFSIFLKIITLELQAHKSFMLLKVGSLKFNTSKFIWKY